ncbi:MAG TPA: 30S ribosomal protein S12 methylthiotransferase RimO [Phycisphaerae bacterium]|nr:30S ribosomal protein S12 methylthiotransferase RimO [Phycisphaerae bacterium]
MATQEPLRVALVSLGCPKNLVDSEKILAHLAEGGCLVGAPMDEADVIVVNTCGFISPAVEESLEVIAEAVARKRAGQVRRVVVAGCLVNRNGEALYDLAPGIDAVVGVNDRQEILSAVTGRERLTRVSPCSGETGSDAGRFRLTPRHTAYLRIAEGCSRKCTFCTIPALRGPFRSKPPGAVREEARELIADGAVELNVIAQDTTGYGRDLGGRMSLASLLEDLAGLDGVEWVRLMYAYPQGLSDELIAVLARCEHVVPYVDLPLQHISDGVLKRMGRRVTRARIERLLEEMRRRIDGLALRTTFLVGFPGETDEQFEELLDFVRSTAFSAVGVFCFCAEAGTPAARLDGRVPPDLARQRRETIMLAQQEIAFRANEQRVGSPIRVLVDGTDGEGICVGRTYGQAPDVDSICKLTEPRPAGSFVDGRVAACDAYDLIVEV